MARSSRDQVVYAGIDLQSMKCPACQATDTAPIVYGMPSSALFEKEKRYKIKIGGCDISPDNPTKYCFACGHEWGLFADDTPGMFHKPQ